MAQLPWTSAYCNPFSKPRHSSKGKNPRPVLPWMCEKVPSLTFGAKICDDYVERRAWYTLTAHVPVCTQNLGTSYIPIKYSVN